MAKRRYEKLVRDRIPELIMANGETPVTKRLNKAEYKKELFAKLKEEVGEIALAKNTTELVNELADVEEVLAAIYVTYGIDQAQVAHVTKQKRKDRGGFTQQLFLITVQ